MGDAQDDRREPGKRREEPARRQGSGPDPVHPEFGRPSRDPARDDPSRHRADDPPREADHRDEEL
ncbi:hypothetical protein [Streptomyces sp. NPDC002044]|uniref:hypothetical protein n=1 Tax=Streptomyces sp. NPDC002044 TaxID=3154662 RepID=UPI00331F9CBE